MNWKKPLASNGKELFIMCTCCAGGSSAFVDSYHFRDCFLVYFLVLVSKPSILRPLYPTI